MSASRGHEKQAGAMVYLMEELGDARLRCDQLQRYIAKATKLVDQSDHKDHLFEVAGDLIRAVPETVFKLHKSLQAVALAAGRIDYEEIKQDLRPEKAEELERVLKDVRIRHVQRRSEPMKPIEALNALKALKAKVEATGKFPVTETLSLIAALEEDDEKDEGSAKEASSPAHAFDLLSKMLLNPPEGSKGPSRQRLAQILRSVVGNSLNREDLTALRVAANVFQEQAKRELKELQDLLKKKGYDPKDAKKLQAEGMGPTELEGRLKNKPGDRDSLEVTHGLKKKASDDEDDDFESREAGAFDFRDLNNLKKYLEDILVEAKKDKNSDIAELAQKALKQMKMASDDDKQGRFEEGKPADPTENMSDDDAKKWKENTDEYGDKFKKEARFTGSPDQLFKKMQEAVKKLLSARVEVRGVEDALTSIYQDATGGTFKDSYNNKAIKDAASLLRDLDQSIGEGFRAIERTESDLKKTKTASAEDKEGRFEEGKPADPTKDMSPEDAKKWKENTDEYGDKFKKEAADTSKLERIFGNIERQVKDFKYSLGVYKKDPGKNAPQMKNIEDALNSIRQSAQLGLKATPKTASDEDKEGRFEEGESADPTENMSPADAKKWKENTDEYGDKFKKEAKAKIDEAAMANLKSVKVSVDNILKGQNPKRNSFTAVQLLGEAMEIMGQDKVSEALYTTASKINSLWSAKDMADYKKASSDPWKAD